MLSKKDFSIFFLFFLFAESFVILGAAMGGSHGGLSYVLASDGEAGAKLDREIALLVAQVGADINLAGIYLKTVAFKLQRESTENCLRFNTKTCVRILRNSGHADFAALVQSGKAGAIDLFGQGFLFFAPTRTLLEEYLVSRGVIAPEAFATIVGESALSCNATSKGDPEDPSYFINLNEKIFDRLFVMWSFVLVKRVAQKFYDKSLDFKVNYIRNILKWSVLAILSGSNERYIGEYRATLEGEPLLDDDLIQI